MMPAGQMPMGYGVPPQGYYNVPGQNHTPLNRGAWHGPPGGEWAVWQPHPSPAPASRSEGTRQAAAVGPPQPLSHSGALQLPRPYDGPLPPELASLPRKVGLLVFTNIGDSLAPELLETLRSMDESTAHACVIDMAWCMVLSGGSKTRFESVAAHHKGMQIRDRKRPETADHSYAIEAVKNLEALGDGADAVERATELISERVRGGNPYGHMIFGTDRYKSHKSFTIAVLQKHGHALEFVSKQFRDDRDVVLAAVQNDGLALEFASAALCGDRDIVLAAVRHTGRALEYAWESMRCHSEIVMAAVQNCGGMLRDAWPAMRADREIVLEAVNDSGDALEYASEALRGDREIVHDAVRNGSCYCLEHASEALRGDREIVLAAVQFNPYALEFASDALKGDGGIVLEATRNLEMDDIYDGPVLRFASKIVREDRDVVLACVKHYGLALEFASDALRGDRDIVFEALKQAGMALRYASETLRGDGELVLAAVRQNVEALKYVSESARNNPEIARTLLREVPEIGLKHVAEKLRGDATVVLEAVRKNGMDLELATNLGAADRLREDRDIVLAAVLENFEALKYAPEEPLKSLFSVIGALQAENQCLRADNDRLRARAATSSCRVSSPPPGVDQDHEQPAAKRRRADSTIEDAAYEDYYGL